MNRPFVRLLLYAGGLSAALWFLHRADNQLSGALSPTDPTLLVMTGLRHAALAAGWYLAAATTAGLIARLARVRPIVRFVDRLTLPPLRRLLDTSLGLSMLATAVASPAAWAEPPPNDHEQPPITMLRLPDGPSGDDPSLPEPPAPSTSTSTSTTPTSTTSAVPPISEATSVETTTTTSAAPTSTTATSTTTTLPRASRPSRIEVVEPPPPAAVHTATGEEWTVQRDDHFWSIAEQLLTRAWARPPTDAETDPYWRQLVEANRHRLADRDNADLLFVGQVLGVPPPPPAPP